MDKDLTLMQDILDFFEMNMQEFSEHSHIPKRTLEGYKSKDITGISRIALDNIIKVKEQKDDFIKRTKELQQKSDDFDKLLEIQERYSKRVH